MKTKLKHVRVNVENFNESLEWYTTTLGFKVAGTWPPEHPNYAHFESDGGATFAIMQDKNFPSPGRFNFDVDNAEELWEVLKERVNVVEELFSTPWGSKKFTICDLSGNELGFVQESK